MKNEQCGFHCTKIKDVAVTLDGNQIIYDVNIHIHCGQVTCIIGQNGAGKSTLVKAIIGEIPHTGKIEFRDTRTDKRMHIKIGYVPQKLNVDYNTPMSVYDLFASYISRKPVCFYKNKKLYQEIKTQLDIFDAGDLIDQCVSELSGGEMQRMLLSIATKPMPNLLVLDEPVSGIDRNGMLLFYDTIRLLKEKYDISVILVSHDLELVHKYADKVILLDQTVLAEGTAEQVFSGQEFREIFGHIQFMKEGSL